MSQLISIFITSISLAYGGGVVRPPTDHELNSRDQRLTSSLMIEDIKCGGFEEKCSLEIAKLRLIECFEINKGGVDVPREGLAFKVSFTMRQGRSENIKILPSKNKNSLDAPLHHAFRKKLEACELLSGGKKLRSHIFIDWVCPYRQVRLVKRAKVTISKSYSGMLSASIERTYLTKVAHRILAVTI